MKLRKWAIRLFLLGFLVYLPSFGNGFVWDDWAYFVDNVYVNDWHNWDRLFSTSVTAGVGTVSNYYRPLSSLTLGVDRQIWGVEPVGFHLSNTVLHGLAGVFLLLLLVELGVPTLVGVVTAAVFLVHPVQVQAVAYMASRGDPQYAMLLFAGLWLYAKSFGVDGKTPHRARLVASGRASRGDKRDLKSVSHLSSIKDVVLGSRRKMLIWAVVLYVMAVLSKEMAVAGVGLFGLILLTRKIQTQNSKLKSLLGRYEEQCLAILVMGAGTIGYLYLRFTIFKFAEFSATWAPDVYLDSVWVRLATFTGALGQYWQMLVWPRPLYFERTARVVTELNGQVVMVLAIILGLVGLGWWEWKQKRRVWIWVGLAWFLGMLVPVSGLVPVNGTVFENWLYVPIAGLGLLVYGILSLLSGEVLRLSDSPHRTRRAQDDKAGLTSLPALSIGVVLGVYSLLSVGQVGAWKDEKTLYLHNLQYAESARLRNNLGLVYAKEGKVDEAQVEFARAVELDGEFEQAYKNLAQLSLRKGEVGQAETYYLKALEAAPDYYFARRELVLFYVESGEYEKAYGQALELAEQTPQDWQAWLMLGRVSLARGEEAEAEKWFGKALELGSDRLSVEKAIGEIREEIE